MEKKLLSKISKYIAQPLNQEKCYVDYQKYLRNLQQLI